MPVHGEGDKAAATHASERSTDGPGLVILTQFLDSLGASARILDAGCGQGRPVDRELRTVGVDLSRKQLRRAGENASTASVVQGDMSRLPISDGVFDAVAAYHPLIHISTAQHQAVIDEFARVLRPGGRVLLTEGINEWNGTNPDWLDTGVEMQWHIAGADTT